MRPRSHVYDFELSADNDRSAPWLNREAPKEPMPINKYHADVAPMKAAILKPPASAHHEHAASLAALLTWNFQLFPKTNVKILSNNLNRA